YSFSTLGHSDAMSPEWLWAWLFRMMLAKIRQMPTNPIVGLSIAAVFWLSRLRLISGGILVLADIGICREIRDECQPC
ncbi:MAG TPA: hypothetical protein VL135_06510, partial [Terracidiphilus sp.]|nr:hypothetical protein [Terracidiphilus sp.]